MLARLLLAASLSYLCERAWVELVLGSDLKADVAAGVRVPGSLGTGLNLSVDLVVVACGEDAQVVCGLDSGGVGTLAVTGGERVLGDGGLTNIVSTFCTDQETLMAECDVEVCGGALEEVGEKTSVDVWLLVVEVELAAVGLLCREVVGEDFGLEAFGEVVLKLELGVEGVGGGPCLGQGKACKRS